MKKKLLIGGVLLALLVGGAINESIAQTSVNKWAIGFHGGITRLNDDFKNHYFATGNMERLARISLQRYVSPHFNLSTAFSAGDVSTYNTVFKHSVTTTVRTGDLTLDYRFFSEDNKWRPYLFAGVGVLYADNYVVRQDYMPTFPHGVGLRWAPLGERLQFDANVRQDLTMSDHLDGSPKGNYNDNFLTYSAGVIFTLGKTKDSDGDGVSDVKDECPDTKKNAIVDIKGCPVDKDEDGVPNNMDKCPDVAGQIQFNGCPDTDGDGIEDSKDACITIAGLVKFNGCPDKDNDDIEDSKDKCPDVAGLVAFEGCPDKDADGVPDHKDRCPDKAGLSQFDGCPDTDGDGIEDSKDRCPDIAGGVGFSGCPEPKKADIEKLQTIAKQINFETGKDVLKESSYPTLDEVAKLMKDNPMYKLSIEGHTDNVGAAAQNLDLSQRRAASVRAYLIDKGVDAERVISSGFGDTRPIDSNKSKAGRANNRRVELKLF